jgi:hypothetical protein
LVGSKEELSAAQTNNAIAPKPEWPMPELVLSAVRRLLDTLDKAIQDLAAHKARNVNVVDFPELSEVILEVLGWTNAAYIEASLKINPAVLRKFVKMRGSVPLHVARAVADRLRNYLRSQDQRSIPSRLAIKPPGNARK